MAHGCWPAEAGERQQSQARSGPPWRAARSRPKARRAGRSGGRADGRRGAEPGHRSWCQHDRRRRHRASRPDRSGDAPRRCSRRSPRRRSRYAPRRGRPGCFGRPAPDPAGHAVRHGRLRPGSPRPADRARARLRTDTGVGPRRRTGHARSSRCAVPPAGGQQRRRGRRAPAEQLHRAGTGREPPGHPDGSDAQPHRDDADRPHPAARRGLLAARTG